jgi:hypothetical protein
MTREMVDPDETITLGVHSGYSRALSNLPLVARLREYKATGFAMVIATARDMRTYLGKIKASTEAPSDNIYAGKPWCGQTPFYSEAHAVRPSEFVGHSLPELHGLPDAARQVR